MGLRLILAAGMGGVRTGPGTQVPP
jgi:hypothetical protein